MFTRCHLILTLSAAGLRFIALHGHIFKEYLTEDSDKMYKRISSWCVHQNKKVRDVAFPALEAFLAQVRLLIVYSMALMELMYNRLRAS